MQIQQGSIIMAHQSLSGNGILLNHVYIFVIRVGQNNKNVSNIKIILIKTVVTQNLTRSELSELHIIMFT